VTFVCVRAHPAKPAPYIDAESGLIYLRARYYDPGTGQFLARDPLVAMTGAAYGHARANPLNPLMLHLAKGMVAPRRALYLGQDHQ
jgi:uncharacterized protein RhaS with RHS repeats